MTSDHIPIMITFKCQNEQVNGSSVDKFRKVYNLNKADWKNFSENLPKSLPSDLKDNVERINKFIVDNIISSADKAIPIYRQNNHHHKHLPNYILELIKLRKKIKKLIRSDNDSIVRTRYNKLTSLIREEIDALKNNEWTEFIKKLGNNPPSTKPFWNRINCIRGKKISSTMPTLIVNNIKYETDEQKANLFASNLSETFSSITNQNFDNEFKSKVEKTIENTDFSKHAYNKKDLFDIKDLNLAITQLNKRSANGEDKVHNKMLQNTHQEFRKIILYLFNETVKQATIPQEWKNSVINMIPKNRKTAVIRKNIVPLA